MGVVSNRESADGYSAFEIIQSPVFTFQGIATELCRSLLPLLSCSPYSIVSNDAAFCLLKPWTVYQW